MLVRAVYELDFEPDTSDIDERFVDKNGLARELTERELKYMLEHQQITTEDFEFTVIDDGDDHRID